MNDVVPGGLRVPLVHYGTSPVQSSCMCRNMLQTRLTCTACEAWGGRWSRLGLWLEENRVNLTPSFSSVLMYVILRWSPQ